MSLGRLAIFVVVVSSLSFALHRYVWARLVRDAALPMPWSRVATVAIIVLGVVTPLAMPFLKYLPRAASRPIAGLLFGWLGLLFLLVAFMALGDLLKLPLAVGRLLSTSSAPVDPDRRLAIARGLALLASIGAALSAAWGVRSVLAQVAVKPVDVVLKRLPKGMSGLRIAQLTDVHVGPTIGRSFIEQIVKRTNALKPDVIAITGDLVDGTVESLRDQLAPLAELKAPLGVYFVTGNHEYISGVTPWVAELRRLGIRVLRNERVELRRGDDVIDLAGVDDYSAGRFIAGEGPDLPRALQGRDATRELILLAHQPKAIVEAAQLGVGLQLSGHTHGGQIFPWNFLVRLQQPYVAGLHQHGDAQVYVSRGTGYWGPPMRVGAPAEITEITLRSA